MSTLCNQPLLTIFRNRHSWHSPRQMYYISSFLNSRHLHNCRQPPTAPSSSTMQKSPARAICEPDNFIGWLPTTCIKMFSSLSYLRGCTEVEPEVEQLQRQVLANMEDAASLTGRAVLSLSQLLENIWALLVDALQ